MKTLTQVQDTLIATLAKCERGGKKMNFAAKVAEKKAAKELESMGFDSMATYRAVCDARDMAKLQVECEE